MLNRMKLRCLSSHWTKGLAHKYLSTSETTTALRPFYFVVHPDLFGQHPAERQVNEESLKKLNEYIGKLHSGRRVSPLSLLFYVRNTPATSHGWRPKQETLRSVRISLLSPDIRDTVTTVLRSCSLPLDHVATSPLSGSVFHDTQPWNSPGGHRPPDRPIDWDPTFYAFYGVPQPSSHSQRAPPNTLGSWLAQNISTAREKQLVQQPIREETERLRTYLLELTGLADIQWDSKWALPQFRSCLRQLEKVYREHRDQLNLTGRILVFGSERGVCFHGNIILCADEVAENWVSILRSIKKRDQILNRLPAAEHYLSTLLKGIQIVRRKPRPIILAEDYLMQVRRLTMTIRDYLSANPSILTPDNLEDLRLVVECASGSLTVSRSGQVVVPVSCPAFLIIDFLNSEAGGIREIQHDYHRRERCEHDIVAECRQMLGLQSLVRDENITLDQMESCCRQLIADSTMLMTSLHDCCVKVAMFYSVISDGEICIPWNYNAKPL